MSGFSLRNLKKNKRWKALIRMGCASRPENETSIPKLIRNAEFDLIREFRLLWKCAGCRFSKACKIFYTGSYLVLLSEKIID